MKIFKIQKYFFAKQINYYKVLKVQKNSSFENIRRQYLKLAKKYHPDLNSKEGSQEKFQEIQKAFETLSNKNSRKQYNQQIGIQQEWEADVKELQFRNDQEYLYYEQLYEQNVLSQNKKNISMNEINQINVKLKNKIDFKDFQSFMYFLGLFGFIGFINVVIVKVFMGYQYSNKQQIQYSKEDFTQQKKGYVPKFTPI